MEDTQQPVQPAEQTTPITEPTEPAVTEPAIPEPVAPGLSAPIDRSVSEESFLRKNKMLIIGGVVALIVITVAVGILLSLKNSEKLEGLIKLRNQTQEIQEQSVKIPRK